MTITQETMQIILTYELSNYDLEYSPQTISFSNLHENRKITIHIFNLE